MKSLHEIIQQTPVFLHDWSNREGVIYDFEEARWRDIDEQLETLKAYQDINILFGSYTYVNYSGDAWVLFEQDGKLYEVSGGHCSCYGLEGQWTPDEVLLEELEHRLLEGTWGEGRYTSNEFKRELCEFLGVEYKSNQTYDY